VHNCGRVHFPAPMQGDRHFDLLDTQFARPPGGVKRQIERLKLRKAGCVIDELCHGLAFKGSALQFEEDETSVAVDAEHIQWASGRVSLTSATGASAT
jgi:hypothetical protein